MKDWVVGNIALGPKTCGFMPHNDGFPFLSRDWKEIDCRRTVCQNNKSGVCGVPSICVIGEDGMCKGFSTQFSKDNKNENQINKDK